MAAYLGLTKISKATFLNTVKNKKSGVVYFYNYKSSTGNNWVSHIDLIEKNYKLVGNDLIHEGQENAAEIHFKEIN